MTEHIPDIYRTYIEQCTKVYRGITEAPSKHHRESTAIKHFLTEFARLAQTAIEKVAQWFVWICKQVGQLNDCELRRADSEIKDLVDGRYDGRIRRFENHHGGLSR